MKANILLAIRSERELLTNNGQGRKYEDLQKKGELVDASLAFTVAGKMVFLKESADKLAGALDLWPWQRDTFRPTASPKDNYIKAIAFLMGEVERLERNGQ